MLFRLRAASALSDPERLHTVLQVTSPREWILVAASGVFFLAVLLWAVFGSIERTASLPCLVVPSGARYAVVSGVTGTVVDAAAAVGDRIEAGAVLARLRQPEIDRELAIARARAARLASESAAGGSGGGTLAAARAAVRDLEEVAAAGGVVTTPWAGVVEYLAFVEGDALASGEPVAQVVAGPGGSFDVVAFGRPDASRGVEPGHPAFVRASAGGVVHEASVAGAGSVLAAPPAWLGRLGLDAAASLSGPGRLISFSPEGATFPFPPGACNVLVVTGEHAPIRLLLPSGDG